MCDSLSESHSDVDSPTIILPDQPPVPSFSSLKPIKAGYLTKQGKSVKSWKKRVFILTQDWLFYYVNQTDKIPRGAIYLLGSSVKEELEVAKSLKSHCFSITSHRSFNINRNKSFQSRIYYFATASRQEMNDWIAILLSISKKSSNITFQSSPTVVIRDRKSLTGGGSGGVGGGAGGSGSNYSTQSGLSPTESECSHGRGSESHDRTPSSPQEI